MFWRTIGQHKQAFKGMLKQRVAQISDSRQEHNEAKCE